MWSNKAVIKSLLCPTLIVQLKVDEVYKKLLSLKYYCELVLVDCDNDIQQTLLGSVSAHRKYQEHLVGTTFCKGQVLIDPEDGENTASSAT
ncbi:hypothetical protein HDV06_006075 [Boothiomyces sp. JEL0866]|nr:hypothetical protein HDV06_006025 [Boothiomyces sp. JEL0866]KAJ3324817.1 hypothetical protein HDV06_006075 [Boothiomyces sp. JEL0866]